MMRNKYLPFILVILLVACAAEAQPTPGAPTETQPPPAATVLPTQTSTPLPSATAMATPENVLPPENMFLLEHGARQDIEYEGGMAVRGAYYGGIWQFSEAAGSLEPFLPLTDVYSFWQPVWSPDGRRIAYVRVDRTTEDNSSIWVKDMEMGEETRILPEIPTREIHTYQGTRAIQIIGWSGSGQKLYYSVPYGSGKWDKLYSVNLETGIIEEIHVQSADDPEIEMQSWGYRLAYNQVTERLLLATCEGEMCDPVKFLLIDLNNPNDAQIFFSPKAWRSYVGIAGVSELGLRDVGFSPDGKTISFIAAGEEGDIQVWTMEVDNLVWERSAVILSPIPEHYRPHYNFHSWSEDGKWLAVWTRYSNGLNRVAIFFIDTESWEIARKYPINENYLNVAGWTIDGNGNPVFGAETSEEGLWLLRPDGSSEHDLLWIESEEFDQILPFNDAYDLKEFSWQP